MKLCHHLHKILPILILSICFAAVISIPLQAAENNYLMYVGTYTGHGSQGIYAYRFNSSTGKFTELGLAAPSDQPSFLAVDPSGKFLYAINEIASYQGKPTGAATSFAINQRSGKLTKLNEVSSRDEGPAFIGLDRTSRFAIVANYTLGSVAVLPIMKGGKLGEATAFVQHKGSSVNPERQQGPHAHAGVFSPDNRFVIIADLGLDQLLVYPFNATNGTLGTPHIVKTHPGAGPRHLIFGTQGKFLYVINEIQSTIVVYSYDAAHGSLHALQTISSLPDDFKGKSTAAEIALAPSGRFLYASNRGDDSVVVFRRDEKDATLKLVEFDSTQGKTPRSFSLDPTGHWLIAADQDSNKLVVFRIDPDTGHLSLTNEAHEVSAPACVLFVPDAH